MHEMQSAINLFALQVGPKVCVLTRKDERPSTGIYVSRPGVAQTLPGGERSAHRGADQQDRFGLPHEPSSFLALCVSREIPWTSFAVVRHGQIERQT